MKIKESPSRKVFNVFNILLMLVIGFICIYPFLYVVFASFSDAAQFFQYNGVLLAPKGFSTAAYKEVFKNGDILRGYGNTIFVVVVGTALNIVLTALGAYFLSRKNVMLKKPIMMMILLTMYISGGLIPSYLNVRSLGLYQSYWALILPGAISTMNLIIMRSAFEAIPESLEDAAHVDGANHFVILFQIVLPLSKATVAVLVLYYGLAHWNDWFAPHDLLAGCTAEIPAAADSAQYADRQPDGGQRQRRQRPVLDF